MESDIVTSSTGGGAVTGVLIASGRGSEEDVREAGLLLESVLTFIERPDKFRPFNNRATSTDSLCLN